jgi:hypothetical protein
VEPSFDFEARQSARHKAVSGLSFLSAFESTSFPTGSRASLFDIEKDESTPIESLIGGAIPQAGSLSGIVRNVKS